MKRILLFITLSVAFFMTGSAQTVPMGMKYQAVARDLSGNVLANQQVALKITLHSDIELKNIEYSETHFAKTNEVGLFTLVIGEGEVITGDFSKVPWSSKDIWMEVSIKDKGAQDYLTISDSRLLAVPYAFHAGTASELVDPSIRAPGNNGVPANVWSLFGNSNTNDDTDRLGTTDCQDLVIITNNLERLRITCGGTVNIAHDLNVGDNLDVGLNLHVGNDLTVDQDVNLNADGGNTTVNGDLTVANMKSTHLTGTLSVDKATDLNSSLNVDGTTTLNDDLTVTGMNPTHLTGTLTVDKATDLNLTLNVDGTTTLNDDLTVTSMAPTHLTGTLEVDKATDLNLTLNVDGNTTLNNDLTVTGMNPTHLTGTLEVDKATDLNSTLNVDGTLTVAGVATINNTLNVNGGGSYVANFVNSSNSNGLSIQVNANTPSSSNDFLTFKDDGGGTVGSVEGQTASELHNSFEYIWYQVMNSLHAAFGVAIIIADIAGLDDPDAAIVEGVELAAAIAEWVEYDVSLELNLGVAYQSGSGDYAEWLEKGTSNEVFSYGDIVGVRGGKISKDLSDADQYMVVSLSPIVLGNMPPAQRTEFFEKVAFMGQVPVKVRGVVNIGDYIIPSDLGDGFGRAVAPLDITLDQFQKIVGVAWSESDGKKAYAMINAAVGINTNDTVDKLKKQQEELDALKLSMNSVISYLQTKDPSFDTEMFAVTRNETAQRNSDIQRTLDQFAQTYGDNKMAAIVKVLNDNPEVMADMMANAKKSLDEKGIDYNRYEQTRRLVNDPNYLISVIVDASK